MQDLRTGEMRELNPAQKKMLEELKGRSVSLTEAMEIAKDEAIPNRADQGPVFQNGEEVEIKGGRFRVRWIGKDRITFDSLPRK